MGPPAMPHSDPQDEVQAMTRRGVRIEVIEDYIETLPLDRERRSALWLLAWTQVTHPPLRDRGGD
jgi:hypothetical protein